MGSWGTGPFDNDRASDMVAGLMKWVCRVATQKSDASYYYEKARAAAKIVVMAHGTDILGGPPLETVLTALRRIRADEVWIGGWKRPRSIRCALDREIARVRRAMKSGRLSAAEKLWGGIGSKRKGRRLSPAEKLCARRLRRRRRPVTKATKAQIEAAIECAGNQRGFHGKPRRDANGDASGKRIAS